MLSLAAVLDRMSRSDAAAIGAMDRQTLRDWAHRFNSKGPEGLINTKPPGSMPKLSPEQKQVLLKRIVESNPDPATDGVVRWRCVDLRRIIKERFAVDLDEVNWPHPQGTRICLRMRAARSTPDIPASHRGF